VSDEITFGFVVPTYGEYADAAKIRALFDLGEQLGYDDIWFGDRAAVPSYALPFCDPEWYEALACSFTALGATSRLRVGTDVLVLPYREPLLLARMIATAGLLSGGRFVLGVGVGYLQGEFAALEVDPSTRGAMTDEYLTVLRQAWTADNPISHAGAHRRFTDVNTGPRVDRGAVPIWVGGNHPAAHERAARFGDGWHPLFPTPDDYTRGRRAIEAAIEAAGPDGRESQAEFAWSYSCPETKLLDRGGEAQVSYTYEAMGEIPADFTYAPPVPTDDDGRPRFIGTVDEVAGDVACYVDAGVRHFTLRFWAGSPGFGVDAFAVQLERFATEVAATFR
jgi:probable F420-dependent oxidoreductase